jgi:hypothetical protein
MMAGPFPAFGSVNIPEFSIVCIRFYARRIALVAGGAGEEDTSRAGFGLGLGKNPKMPRNPHLSTACGVWQSHVFPIEMQEQRTLLR